MLLERRAKREKEARLQAEEVLEAKSRELFNLNNQLKSINQNLEQAVVERTKELEREKALAEQSNRAKTQFIANVSHDIRTPLNAIIGLTTILLEQIEDLDDHALLVDIDRAANTLFQIVSQTLDFARIESDQFSLSRVPTDLHQFPMELSSLFLVGGKKKENITFSVLVDANIKHSYLLDPIALKQVLINIITNAFKFTKQGSVAVEFNLLSKHDQYDEIEIKIIDTGAGISEEHLDIIFERYTQIKAENDISTRQGFGIGLSICKRIIKRMDGTIDVASEVGRGTEFTIKLPCQHIKQDDTLIKRPIMQNSHFPIDILVVDDNQSNLTVAKLLLEKLGATVVTALSGHDGLHFLEQQTFDIVFLDMQMPQWDGFETFRHMRQTDNGQKAKIIMMTANAQQAIHEQCLEVGMDDYTTKPIIRSALIDLLNKHAPQDN